MLGRAEIYIAVLLVRVVHLEGRGSSAARNHAALLYYGPYIIRLIIVIAFLALALLALAFLALLQLFLSGPAEELANEEAVVRPITIVFECLKLKTNHSLEVQELPASGAELVAVALLSALCDLDCDFCNGESHGQLWIVRMGRVWLKICMELLGRLC